MGRVVKLGHGHGHGHVGGLAVAVALVAGCGAPAAAPQPEKRTPAVHFFVDSRPQGNPHAIAEGTDGAVRYGDPFVLVVDGLASGAHASIEARVYGMLAQADFIAHDDGSIDLSRDAPVSGTWDGVDPEALLWSMSAEPGVTPPAQLDLSVQVKVLVDGKDVVDGALARRFINQDLTQETVNSGRTVGELVVPPGDGPFPAVLVFGGSEGGTGTGEFDGEYLGSLGYA
ncbi:MAG TPA: acyl-CoA thioesterase/BAAT N-terminal domain-containing protein, partial [Myxococcota bacterium]